MPELLLAGEHLLMHERVIVAPAVGIFRPFAPETVTAEGEIVVEGQQVGVIEAMGEEQAVHSPFTGFLMGMLAAAGDRVRAGQPLVWLRAVGSNTASERDTGEPIAALA